MTYKIPEEPPEEIIRAYNDGYLAIFIGAGLSENFGIPLWGGLVNNLLNTCLKNVDGFTKKDYNYYKSQDYKKAISYVKSILGDSFFEQIKTKLGKIKNWDDENNIYKKLFEFMVDKDINGNINDCSGIFLTTNADLCLDNFFNEKEIINSPDKLDENFHIHLEDADNNIKLVHLHGSIKDKDSLVFTDEDYLNQYKKTDYIKLLDIIFNKYTILFMGYSLSEWEILKFLIDNLDWKHQKKHFVLLGYPEDNTEKIIEINKIKNDHENNGLKIIPYDYTYTENQGNCTENHENLCKIIDKWNQNKDNFLNEITRFDEKINDIFYDYDDLKQNINDNKKEKIRQLFICAFKRSSDRKYLINKLCNSKEKLFWFNFLYGDSSSDKNELNEDELIKYKLSMELLHNLNLLQYQRLISEYNVIPHFDDKVNSILLNIVDNWYEYFEENNANVDRNFNFNVFEMLFNIPEENFKKKHGNFALDIFKKDDDKVVIFTLINKFNKLILANQKVIIKKFLKEMMSYYNIFDTIKSKHKIYYLKKFLSKNTANISKYMLKDAIKIVIGIIEKINNDTVYDFYEVKAIEDLEDDVDTIPDKDNYSTILIHYLRDLIILHNDDDYYEDIYKYSEKFYKSDIIILNRISYYLIDKYYDNLKDIIWNSDKNPLNSKSSHEFSSILSNHKDNLKGEEINKLIGWIENINDFYKKLPSTSSSLKSIKKGWYCCLNQNNKEIKKILVNYKNVKAEDPHELNNKNQKISSSFYNELKNKTNNELIAFIEEKERSNDINCFELELVFEEIIGEKINQTVNEINNFLVLPLKYQISLFHVLLNKNIIFNEKINQFKVINYINDLLNSIQKNKDSMEEKLYYGIVGYLRRYGDNLNKKDDFFEDILIKVYGHVKQFKGDSFQECFDYCNDNFSKIYKIMIRYELKLENKEKNKIKIFLTEQLSKNEYELLYFVGYYLNNLYIQDNNWVKRNFDKIFPKKDNLWKYALRGYLESYPFKKRNNELIDYLNNKKLFNKIVNEEFRKNYYKQSVHFIFLEQDNNILDDLLENITEVESLEIIEIIHNLINKENITKYNNILIKIWGQLLIKFKENKNVFSEINIWIELINEINDDNFNLLLKSIDYLDADDYYYTRELKRLVDTSPEEVCKLLLNKKEILLHHPNELKYILDTLERKNFEKPYLLKIKRKYKRKGYIYS